MSDIDGSADGPMFKGPDGKLLTHSFFILSICEDSPRCWIRPLPLGKSQLPPPDAQIMGLNYSAIGTVTHTNSTSTDPCKYLSISSCSQTNTFCLSASVSQEGLFQNFISSANCKPTPQQRDDIACSLPSQYRSSRLSIQPDLSSTTRG
ncbi:hypothetical protein Hypma_005521 [Hypsizygus marmoreus]|uniref:Uncharacterized protein n=1 Tax=Hypsizygus marmoreus TaxID=39966 RepID=A0A369K453_HYPMA|nr:hypothetical protein Hypma_005521 [Hypsizygus marmoreus]